MSRSHTGSDADGAAGAGAGHAERGSIAAPISRARRLGEMRSYWLSGVAGVAGVALTGAPMLLAFIVVVPVE